MQEPAKRFRYSMVKLVYDENQDFFLQKGDYVDIDFLVSGMITAGQVVSLKTTGKDKVLVDVDVVIEYGAIKKTKVRIHGIDSHLCRKRTPDYLKSQEKNVSNIPVFEAWNKPNVLPDRTDARPEIDASVDVLIDIDGKGECYDIGFYNFKDQEWWLNNRDLISSLDDVNMKWRSI